MLWQRYHRRYSPHDRATPWGAAQGRSLDLVVLCYVRAAVFLMKRRITRFLAAGRFKIEIAALNLQPPSFLTKPQTRRILKSNFLSMP